MELFSWADYGLAGLFAGALLAVLWWNLRSFYTALRELTKEISVTNIRVVDAIQSSQKEMAQSLNHVSLSLATLLERTSITVHVTPQKPPADDR